MSVYTAPDGNNSSCNNNHHNTSYGPLPTPPLPHPPSSHSPPPGSHSHHHHHQSHFQPHQNNTIHAHRNLPSGRTRVDSLSSDTTPHLGVTPVAHSFSFPGGLHTNFAANRSNNVGHLDEPKESTSASSAANSDKQKGNRLRKACDSCSIRKVKCDETGPPCRACAALDIPCTFDRPSRRRGPPNRHSEAIKKKRLESPGGVLTSPESPNHVITPTLASFSHSALNAESICPISILELLIDDFFTYIHPICPFPHEPSFRAALSQREDLHNPTYLALLASMVGVLVASFPRKPRLHLKAQRHEHLFPNCMSLVDRCHKVAVESRGTGYLDKDLTIYDAVTSYFLALTGAHTFQWKQSRVYYGETITITRILGAHKATDISTQPANQIFNADGSGPQPQPVDFIRQEIARRIYWAMFVSVRTMQQLGALVTDLIIPPPTPTDPYPPLPLEVDDEYIYVDRVDPQPPGILSRITGYNLNIKIYATVTPLATIELAYGVDEIFDWDHQKRVLESCLCNVKHVLDDAPSELLLHAEPLIPNFSDDENQYISSQYEESSDRIDNSQLYQNGDPETQRRLQYEIQKANIYASQLATRSYLVEKYLTLQETHERFQKKPKATTDPSRLGILAPGFENTLNLNVSEEIENKFTNERENVVKDLLFVLCNISQVNMEPNGASLHNKIRQIASTLIDTPQDRKEPLIVKAEGYLCRFLDILMKLERITPNSRDGESQVDVEEEELRNWADMREYQMAFARAGGFLAHM